MSLFRLALLSLIRHKFATGILIVSIALSVACCGILIRLYELSESRFSNIGIGGDAIVGAKAGGIEILLGALNSEGDYPGFLPLKLFESLKADQVVMHADGIATNPGYIEKITPLLYFGKFYDFRIFGTDESFFQNLRPERTIKLHEGQAPQNLNEVVVGRSIADKYGLSLGSEISGKLWIGGDPLDIAIPLKVAGILASTKSNWDWTLLTQLALAQSTLELNKKVLAQKSIWGSQVLNYFLVDLKPGKYFEFEELINRRTVGQVIDVREQKNRLMDLSGAGKGLGIVISFFVLALGSLSVVSMFTTRFEGMAPQIAVLRAIGYTKLEMLEWLIFEVAILCLIGILAGACIDFALFPYIKSFMGSALPSNSNIEISIFQSAIVWILSFVAVLISTLFPFLNMSRQDIHDSLRGL